MEPPTCDLGVQGPGVRGWDGTAVLQTHPMGCDARSPPAFAARVDGSVMRCSQAGGKGVFSLSNALISSSSHGSSLPWQCLHPLLHGPSLLWWVEAALGGGSFLDLISPLTPCALLEKKTNHLGRVQRSSGPCDAPAGAFNVASPSSGLKSLVQSLALAPRDLWEVFWKCRGWPDVGRAVGAVCVPVE